MVVSISPFLGTVLAVESVCNKVPASDTNERESFGPVFSGSEILRLSLDAELSSAIGLTSWAYEKNSKNNE